MSIQVHVHSKVDRQLTALESRTNAPATAAMRAREVIRRLSLGEGPQVAGLMRPRSDRRVKNSLKFNLGQGFRLVCIREKQMFYVLFVGDHDSADAWLDRYTRKNPIKTVRTWICCQSNRLLPLAGRSPNTHPQDEDPDLMEISQEMLRRVFRGLVSHGLSP